MVEFDLVCDLEQVLRDGGHDHLGMHLLARLEQRARSGGWLLSNRDYLIETQISEITQFVLGQKKTTGKSEQIKHIRKNEFV